MFIALQVEFEHLSGVKEKIFMVGRDQGELWYKANVTLPSEGRVYFKAVFTSVELSDIAIGRITVLEGPCEAKGK